MGKAGKLSVQSGSILQALLKHWLIDKYIYNGEMITNQSLNQYFTSIYDHSPESQNNILQAIVVAIIVKYIIQSFEALLYKHY